MYLADYADTHDVLSCVDALVSPLSTIILEGALHGKPVLCLLPKQKQGRTFDLQARLVHFEDLYRCPEVLIADGEAALVGAIKELLERVGDAAAQISMQASCEQFVASLTGRSRSELSVSLNE